MHRINEHDDRMKQLYLHIMKWFLPVLFISYMAGITLFTHSHVVNGVTIVHSHPFKKGSEHSHTTVEFQLIHLLSHVLVTDSGLIPTFSVAALSLLCILFVRPQIEQFLLEHLLSLSLSFWGNSIYVLGSTINDRCFPFPLLLFFELKH